MEVNVSYDLSNEDLKGVLRTLYLFLESIRFSSTSKALQNECVYKGLHDAVAAASKIVVVHQSLQQFQTQTDFPEENEKFYVIHSTTNETDTGDEDSNLSSQTFHLSGNEYWKNHKSCCVPIVAPTTSSGNVKKPTVHKNKQLQQKESNNSKKSKKSVSSHPPNTIESDSPSTMAAKTCCTGEKRWCTRLKRSHSNPVLKVPEKNTDHKTINIEANDNRPKSKHGEECEDLKKRFCLLQDEHKKLMGVTTELTTALQTHILGQSENLNSMLNNCKNIYPDLFKSFCNPNCNCQNIPIKQNSRTHVTHDLSQSKPSCCSPFSATRLPHHGKDIIPHDNKNCVCAPRTRSGHNLKSISQSSQISTLVSPINSTNKGSRINTIQNKNSTSIVGNSAHSIKKTSKQDADVSPKPKRNNLQSASHTSKSSRSRSKSPSSSPSRDNKNSNISKNTMPLTKSSPSIDKPILKKSGVKKNISRNSSPSNKTIQNSDDVITLSLRSNKISFKDTSQLQQSHHSKPIQNRTLSPRVTNEANDEEEVKVTDRASSHSSFHSTAKLKQPTANSISVETMNEAHILVKCSRSVNESILQSNYTSSHDDIHSTYTEEVVVTRTTQIPEARNITQQTDINNQEFYDGGNVPGENHYFDLDFKKLKRDMLIGDVNLKLGIIQALRWRIIESDSATRDQVISSYVRHDLLGLHSAPNACGQPGQSVTEVYYCPNTDTPHILQEGMARMVNTFASLTVGRDYLCQDDDLVISLLVPLVIGTHYSKVKISPITRDMLMATLQKLSIRNKQRMRMISAGLVEHLVTFLATEHNTISEYCMEYSTALLMNLCLHHEARELLRSSATDVVSLLADLMNTKYRSCMPYVNGAMFSLLGDPYINKEAHRLNLAKLIEYHIKQTHGEMRRQLEFILKLHLSNGQTECGCDPNLEPENEVDLLEVELNRGDSCNVQPAGEAILQNYRLLVSTDGAQVNSYQLNCLCRPITPRAVNSTHLTDDNNDNFDNSDNDDNDKLIQAYEEEIVEATDFQVEHICKCAGEKSTRIQLQKSTQSENSNENINSVNSHTSKLCTCATTATASTMPDNLNTTCCISNKHGIASSEPIPGFKSDTVKTKQQAPLSAKGSRSNSPDMSYCEETKQFYHTPSAKNGIFEPQKQKKLHRVAPSFTRTIPLAKKADPPCGNPFCPTPYSKTMPITPKENSSISNPPYGLNYPGGCTGCYRECYVDQARTFNNRDESNTFNRPRCNCYNVIKGYIDHVPQDNTASNRNHNNSPQETERSFPEPTQNVCCCHNPNNIHTRCCTKNYDNYTPINHGNEVVIDFSYPELLKAVRPDINHVCPSPEGLCQCYDVVFQSRPKILRTPP